jgi:hypothetical protein
MENPVSLGQPPETREPTYLVKVLQQVDYPAFNLLLVQTGRSGVGANGLEGETRSELSRTSDGRAANLEGSGSPDGTRHGGPERTDNGGTEHCDRERRRENLGGD